MVSGHAGQGREGRGHPEMTSGQGLSSIDLESVSFPLHFLQVLIEFQNSLKLYIECCMFIYHPEEKVYT